MLTGRVLARLAGSAVLGLLIGVIGTSIHRSRPPLGLALALLVVVVAGVLTRAWAGPAGMFVLAMTIAGSVAVLGAGGPGGDVLIAGDALGYVWYCGAAVVSLAALAPRRWFSDQPLAPPQA